MSDKNSAKLEKLKKQKQVISARILKIEARERRQIRKHDTRRKILVGAYYLDKAKKENKMAALVTIMDKFLKRDSDRALFNLPIKK